MTATMSEKIAKLPAWARGVIDQAEREVEILQRRVADLEAQLAGDQSTGTDTWVRGYAGGPDQPLRRGSVICFGTDPDRSRSGYIEAYAKDDGILYVRGARSVQVFPQSSNVIEVQVVER